MPDPALNERKRTARRAVRARLGAMDDAAAAAASARVRELVAGTGEFAGASAVMAFLPLPGEPDLEPLLRDAGAAGRAVCLPRTDWDAGTIRAVRVGPGDWTVRPGRHGLREPDEGETVDPGALDLILVPGLAFDARGRRLGRGAGFYDRFLAPLRPPGEPAARPDPDGPRLIGVAFEAQMLEETPEGERDVRVDAVVTDARVYRW